MANTTNDTTGINSIYVFCMILLRRNVIDYDEKGDGNSYINRFNLFIYSNIDKQCKLSIVERRIFVPGNYFKFYVSILMDFFFHSLLNM